MNKEKDSSKAVKFWLLSAKVRDIVNDYIKKLKKEISVERAILFGSFAHGRPNYYSDIDIAIISSNFKRMNDIKRIMFLSDIARKVKSAKSVDIDPVGFTKEELNKAGYFDLASEIQEKGITVYSASPQ